MENSPDFEDFLQNRSNLNTHHRQKPSTESLIKDQDERIQIIKNFYEKRIEVLKEDVKMVYQKIISDDLFHTMKEDPTSLEFVNMRVREIFEEVINNDREIILEKIYKQYAYLKAEYKKLEEEKKKVAKLLFF